MGVSRHPGDYDPVMPSRFGAAPTAEPEPIAWPQPRRHGDTDGDHVPVAPPIAGTPAPAAATQARTQSPARRGHVITYLSLFLFSFVLLTRPSDWYPNAFTLSLAFYLGVITLGVFLVTQFVLEGNLTTRPREVHFALALLLAGFMSIPFADQDRGYAYDIFMDNFIRAIFMFIVMVNVVRTERRLRWLLLLGLGVGIYLAVNAVHDYATGNLAVEGYRVQGAIGGMFANPNDLAGYLVCMIPIAIAFICVTRGVVRRFLYVLSLVALLGGVVVTFSRGGSIALTVIVFVLTWKLGKRHRTMFMTLALVGYIGFLAAAPGGYRGRLLSIFNDDLEMASGSSAARKELLKESVKVALRHPVLGIGMGNFRVIYKLWPHNAYTQVAAEMGLFGFYAYLLFLITPFKRLREIERATNGDPAQRRIYFMAICLQATLLGYMVSSFFGNVAYLYNVYYFVGYAVSFRMIYYHTIGVPVNARALPRPADESNTIRPRAAGHYTGAMPELSVEAQ